MFKFIRWVNTIKYLKPIQILGRLLYYFPRWINPLSKAPRIRNHGAFSSFIKKKQITADFDKFKFLNETHYLSNIGWDNENISKLWRYNLHYFDFLNAEENGIYIIEKWINENPFGQGTGWEPFPTSYRIINWIKWHWNTGGLTTKAIVSLWNQTRWLARRPEYHILGNHLLLNAKALLFASVFFELKTEKIRKKALKILNKQLDDQFLEDGAHFELSPMYHALVLEDLMDIYNIHPSKKIKQKITKGLDWLDKMIYPNGDLAHFNDTANGIASTLDELKFYAERLNINYLEDLRFGLFKLSDSGYIIFKDSDIHLIADCGNIGPDYLPGHAHADTLSFEFAIKDARVIVNSGTSEYGLSKERLRQRSTSAHSTIEVDGTSSSEVWSGFRVGRRARIQNLEIFDSEDNFMIKACHDGYKRLQSKPIHSRTWKKSNFSLIIDDEVSGLGNNVVSRFYIHPDIKLLSVGNEVHFYSEEKLIGNFHSSKEYIIESSTFHDEFGISRQNHCIIIQDTTPFKSRCIISWGK